MHDAPKVSATRSRLPAEDGQLKVKAIWKTSYMNHAHIAIHKATGSLVTSHSQRTASWNVPQRPFLPAAPFDSQWTLFCSTGIVLVKIMEELGTVRPASL